MHVYTVHMHEKGHAPQMGDMIEMYMCVFVIKFTCSILLLQISLTEVRRLSQLPSPRRMLLRTLHIMLLRSIRNSQFVTSFDHNTCSILTATSV